MGYKWGAPTPAVGTRMGERETNLKTITHKGGEGTIIHMVRDLWVGASYKIGC